MKRLFGALIALLILGGIWGMLLVIGLVAGVVPGVGGDGDGPNEAVDHEGDAGSADATVFDASTVPNDGGASQLGEDAASRVPADAGTTEDAGAHDAGHSDAGDARDAGGAEVAGHAASGPRLGTTPSSPVGDRWRLGDDWALRSPRPLAVGPLFDGPRPTVVVTFDRTCHVFGVLADGRLLRTHAIEVSESREGVRVEHGRPAIGDVTGDGRADLVVPFWFRSGVGGSRGGGVWLLAGRPDGALARPVRVGGRFMPQSVALADLDGRGGLDLVIGDRGRPWGEQPAHVRIFRGGRRPTQVADRASTLWSGRVAVLDLDLDGRLDVVSHGNDEATLFATTPRLRLGEGTALGMSSYYVVAADLDGDGHRDLVSGARTMEWIRAGDPDRRRRPLAGISNFLPVRVLDATGDGRDDVLLAGWLGNSGISVLDGRSRRLITLVAGRNSSGQQSTDSSRSVYDAALADLDADGVLDLLAVVGDNGRAYLWVVRSAPVENARLRLTARDIEDAPSMARIALR